MEISRRDWDRYIESLRRLSEKASDEMLEYMARTDLAAEGAYALLIEFAYALATKYGEGASALVCEMYDALAEISGVALPAAEPAATATYPEVAKAVNGTRFQNPRVTADAIGRTVKMAGVDTIMQNAIRDGAEWAWIPSGDTCAFCITLASRGWQRASKKALKNGHAEHIHANCDCTYMVRFSEDMTVEGYDPEEYREMYYDADGNTPEERINSMRRKFYAENKEAINAQKRSAYAKRIELNSSAAEETKVN